jgi:fructose-1,6-bisphosphatase/inositol monophosphatase family enzyme
VDPLDGTNNFVAGSADWVVMVALVERGNTVGSWIWQPVSRRMYRAERGSGAWCNGSKVSTQMGEVSEASLRGAVLTRFLDPGLSAVIARNSERFGEISGGRMSAGIEYPAVVDGEEHFALFWRTLPW